MKYESVHFHENAFLLNEKWILLKKDWWENYYYYICAIEIMNFKEDSKLENKSYKYRGV